VSNWRVGCTVVLCVAISAGLAAGNQAKSKDPTALPKKGDAVALRGCLRGAALEATDVEGEDSSTPLLSGVTFRLTGKKDLLKDMKEKHDGRIVQVRGTLKSDLQQHAGYGANLGGMRITIGGPTAGGGARDMEPRRSLPVVDVSSFTGGETSCAR
jgi:hypothetical protein